MSHFLYFKKLKEIFPYERIDTEYPGKDWLLSEIIATLIVNDPRLQQYIGLLDGFSILENMQNAKISDKITKFYIQRNNFSDFIKDSRKMINCVRL